MSLPTLPPIHSLPSSSTSIQTQTLDTLFEPTPELHALALPLLQPPPPPSSPSSASQVQSYEELIEKIRRELLTLVDDVNNNNNNNNEGEKKRQLEGILGSHPRLGEKKVDSALSRLEQAKMVAASSSSPSSSSTTTVVQQDQQQQQQQQDEATMLKHLNEEYERTFPGLRYVVFVNGRPRSVIMQNMRTRIQRADVGLERREGVDAMCDIARDRCGKLGAL